MYDLIYCDPKEYRKLVDIVRGHFPEAKIEDASDEVHEARFSVELPHTHRETYQRMLVNEEMAGCSLELNMMAIQKPEHLKALCAAAKIVAANVA